MYGKYDLVKQCKKSVEYIQTSFFRINIIWLFCKVHVFQTNINVRFGFSLFSSFGECL